MDIKHIPISLKTLAYLFKEPVARKSHFSLLLIFAGNAPPGEGIRANVTLPEVEELK